MALQLLLGFNAAICVLVAILGRERVRDARLGSWDEALALTALCLVTHFLASAPKHQVARLDISAEISLENGFMTNVR